MKAGSFQLNIFQEYTLTELIPGTVYNISVFAFAHYCDSPPATVYFTTLACGRYCEGTVIHTEFPKRDDLVHIDIYSFKLNLSDRSAILPKCPSDSVTVGHLFSR